MPWCWRKGFGSSNEEEAADGPHGGKFGEEPRTFPFPGDVGHHVEAHHQRQPSGTAELAGYVCSEDGVEALGMAREEERAGHGDALDARPDRPPSLRGPVAGGVAREHAGARSRSVRPASDHERLKLACANRKPVLGALDMAGQVRLSRGEWWALLITALVGCLLWFGLMALPWIALHSDAFKLKSEDEVSRVQSVLQQLGTYGDLFGSLNCLFSGAAFFGIVYAVILQRRELHHQHEAADEARRTTELQNRLSLYQYLVSHHRHEGANAGSDVLLASRSRGRERAYVELISGLLRDLEALAAGNKPSQQRIVDYYDHPLRIAIIHQRYCEEDDVGDPSSQFGPVSSLLLELVEEIAALTELNRGNEDAKAALLGAGHAINAAIRPQDLLEPEQLDDADYHRGYQIRKAQEAFAGAFRALTALGITVHQR